MTTFLTQFRPQDPPSSSRIYLDHNATTPVAQFIIDKSLELMKAWGNPSSIHQSGREPKRLLRECRQKIAQVLNCHPLEIVFTSGGSESNVTVLRSVLEKSSKRKLVLSSVEHPSVFKTAQKIKEIYRDIELCVLPVNRRGGLDIGQAKKVIDQDTALVSVMYANNETGNIFPIRELVEWTHAQGAYFHCDAVQALGKVPIDLKRLDVDFASFSAHKVYSLKGTGFLFIKKDTLFSSLISGGGQERGRRAGTENILGIGALGEIMEFLPRVLENSFHVEKLRNQFEELVVKKIENIRITGCENPRLPNTSSLVLDGVDGEVLLMSLDVKGFSVSTGAACSSGNPEPSPVLLNMGLTREEAQSSLRVSFGLGNTEEDVRKFVDVLSAVVNHLRSLEKNSRSKKIDQEKRSVLGHVKSTEFEKGAVSGA